MPTYQYRCNDCATDLEIVQKFSDPTLTDCPECDGSLRKVYSAVGVVFKGSGFYATDNRSSKSTAAARSESSTSSKKESSSSTPTTSSTSDKGSSSTPAAASTKAAS